LPATSPSPTRRSQQVIDELLPSGNAAKGGRPPYPTGVMVRILILNHVYNLSDEQLDYQLLHPSAFAFWPKAPTSPTATPSALGRRWRNGAQKHDV
jgi:hypothetical protein